jgi:hypothetical protein
MGLWSESIIVGEARWQEGTLLLLDELRRARALFMIIYTKYINRSNLSKTKKCKECVIVHYLRTKINKGDRNNAAMEGN